MDVNYVSTSPARSPLNETEEIINQWNVILPSYLYIEIPAVFDTIGAMLNIAIIVYFIKSKKYRSPTFTILTNLAAMDTFVCLSAATHTLITPKVVSPKAGFMCSLNTFGITTGILGSEYILILFVAVRLYQVMSPLKAMAFITMSLMIKCCATIIAVAVVIAILHASYWRSVTTVVNGEDTTLCFFIVDAHARDMGYLIGLTAIPCSTIFIIHMLKYFAYIRSKGLLSTKQERKSPDARVIAIIIVLFYICWIPVTTYILVQSLRIDNFAHIMQDSVYAILAHAAFANSIMNPLVYVLAMKSIRDDVMTKLFCFARQSNSK